jgi:hypothetical protein
MKISRGCVDITLFLDEGLTIRVPLAVGVFKTNAKSNA